MYFFHLELTFTLHYIITDKVYRISLVTLDRC